MDTVNVRPKVCRNLFGKPSAEEVEKTRKLMKDTYDEDVKCAKSKYNFDFVEDVPLQGQYEWTATACPSFYTKGYAPTKFRDVCISRNLKRRLSFEDTESDSDTHEMCEHVTDVSSNTDSCKDAQNDSGFSSPSAKPLVQTQISKFMKKRKRAQKTASSKSPRLRF